MPLGADIFGDEPQSAQRGRRAGFDERVGKKNANTVIGLQCADSVAQPVLGNSVGANEKLEPE